MMKVCNVAHYTPFTMFYEIRFISSLSMHYALFCESAKQRKSLSKEPKKSGVIAMMKYQQFSYLLGIFTKYLRQKWDRGRGAFSRYCQGSSF